MGWQKQFLNHHAYYRAKSFLVTHGQPPLSEHSIPNKHYEIFMFIHTTNVTLAIRLH